MRERPWILERLRKSPDALAFARAEESLDWRALSGLAFGRAAFLQEQGIGTGSLISVRTSDASVFASFLHAAQLLGATLLPIHARLTEGEVATQLGHAEPAAHFDHPEPAPARDEAPAGLPEGFDPEADFVVLFTSGTSGRAKAARLSHRSFAAHAKASAAHLGGAPDDRWLACLPLFHVGGISILVRNVLSGVPVFVHDGFDPARVRDALASERITHVSLVPTMLKRLLELPGGMPAFPALRVILLGGAAASPELLERAGKAGLPVCPTYGLTEACSQVATALPSDGAPGFARPLPGVEVRIQAEPGAARGEIQVRGPTVFSGYWRDPEATARAFEGGWLRTGDTGSLDEEGRLRVFGREGDLLVTGGENVSPLEIETVLESHPAVVEAAVLGVADPDLGERVVALVVLKGDAPDPEALRLHCRERLAGFKRPRELRRAPALPRNALGKLLRRELAQRFWNSESWSR